MNLRALGSAPFHMKVKFHAFPGMDLLHGKEPGIVSGDGVYEETWITPYKWRREVTLGNYHAVETHNDRTRKMQASSDYEPSRVLMLLDALLNPISRDALSPELQQPRIHWKMDRPSVQGHPLVRVSNSYNVSNHISGGTTYLFLPKGLLIQSNESNIVTTWEDDAVFGGRVVPGHISIQVGAARDLLTAEVEVGEPGEPDAEAFDLPGDPADPGMTLRPLHWYEVRVRGSERASSSGSNGPEMVARTIMDRHGAMREFEILYAALGPGKPGSDSSEARHWVGGIIEGTQRPAEIDGSPCEIAFQVYSVILPQQQTH